MLIRFWVSVALAIVALAGACALTLHAQESSATPLPGLVLSALALEELKQPAPQVAPPRSIDLTVPTVFYIAAVSGAWAGASATCVEDDVCKTVTPVLPTVGSPMKALGWGLLIQGGVLWVAHVWIAPRWPRVAQGVLYGLAALHIASGTDHVLQSRRISKAANGVEP